MMHPLHTKEWIDEMLAQGYSRYEISSRRTGRSTSHALRAIAWCINNPGSKLRLADHFGTKQADQHFMRMIRDMVARLELKHIHFEGKNGCWMIFENRKGKP